MNEGDVIIIPTDTVYGLATRLYDKKGLQKIYAIKARDLFKQIPILISDIEQLKEIAGYDGFTKKVMKIFWPGPLTIVLDTTEAFKRITGEDTIAVRMPKHPKTLDIINKQGVLRVTSLNMSGEPPLEDPAIIKAMFESKVKAIYWQGNYAKSNLASTVARISKDKVEILRDGAITKEDILSLRTNSVMY